ncbi:MAG: AbrB family transcriptional regulator [Mobilitalea sp.]
MEVWIQVVTTLMIAALCGWLARKIRLPSGAMIGAIIATATLNILTKNAVVLPSMRLLMQIAGGILLGHSISKSNLVMVRSLGKATVVLIAGLITLNISMGMLIHYLCGIDLSTSLFATAPGGVSDMALIADELGADTSVVSLMQLFRMFGIYFIFPPVMKVISQRKNLNIEVAPTLEEKLKIKDEGKRNDDKSLLLTVICGIVGGLLLNLWKVPAGGLVGSVLACSLFNIVTGKGYVPSGIRFPIQVGVGTIIGAQMTKESLLSFHALVIPILIMLTGLLIFTFLFGILLMKSTNLDFATCLLSLTPGGIQETSLLADDLGCDTATVIVMHTIRLVVVICIFPTILSLFVRL